MYRAYVVPELLYALPDVGERTQLQGQERNKRNLDGRYLIRNSGTEPLLRVLVEASNNEEMESFLEELLNKINGYLN